MGHTQGGAGALELGTGITVIGHGIMAKETQAIGVDDQRQAVMKQEAAKMLEVIPRGVGGDEDRAQELA
jgi:3-oxoacyl-(acyl-carrier-protein) synthase